MRQGGVGGDGFLKSDGLEGREYLGFGEWRVDGYVVKVYGRGRSIDAFLG